MFRGDKPELSFSEEIFTSMWRLGQTFGRLALLEYLSFLFFFFSTPVSICLVRREGFCFVFPNQRAAGQRGPPFQL